jgi:hypothetical protein
MKKQSHHFLLLGLLILLSGCATPTTYHWGEYEEQVYVMYAAPDQGTVASQLDVLELDIEKARLKNQPLAPGIRAHMGFLYFQAGRLSRVRSVDGPFYWKTRKKACVNYRSSCAY